MAATVWTRTTFILLIFFWALQLLALISHLTFVTYWIGLFGSKVQPKVSILPYVYTTLLVSFAFFTFVIITEISMYIRSGLPLERYHKLQFIKMRILLAEIITLAILCHGTDDLLVWKVLAITAFSRFPFKFSCTFGWLLKRKESKRAERESKEADEETPLLE